MSRPAILLILATTLLLAGCGDEQRGAPSDTTVETTASAARPPASKPVRVLRDDDGGVLEVQPGCGPVPAKLRGAWTYQLDPEDLPPEFADARTGRAERIYGPGYRYEAPVAGEGTVRHACVRGTEVHMSEHPDCPGTGNEVLRWRVRGDELTLTPTGKRCFLTVIHFGDPPRSRTLRRSGPAPEGSSGPPAEVSGR